MGSRQNSVEKKEESKETQSDLTKEVIVEGERIISPF